MRSNGHWQFWIDRGGTFTDIVAITPAGEIRTSKYLSNNPDLYDDAAIHGIRQLLDCAPDETIPGEAIAAIKMGTTVATNALLERKGAPTVFVTSCGMGDALEIGYQARPDTFALRIKKSSPLYDEVIEVEERVLANGEVAQPLDLTQAQQQLEFAFDRGFRCVAIALMHGYKYTAHERALAELAREIGFTQVSTSHEVSPLAKLVSRAETTVVDAYLTPILRRYVDQVDGSFDEHRKPRQLLFMQSSGGLTSSDRFRGRDAILSGPAGGIVGCVDTAKAAGFDKIIGFDMGGTSTDVSHYAGEFEKRYETEVAGVRMRVPMLHIHTVAAGGGSITRYAGGRFRVGPDSAGADPGPACYRRGGPLAVTDVNLFLGKLHPDFFPSIFGPEQNQPLDREAAQRGFEKIAQEIGDGRSAEQVAEGFLDVAVEHMAQAIKQISLARGYDTKEYVLNCFGGAGGQHACLVAERLGITKILVHPHAGVLSAFGMGLAPIQSERQFVIGREIGPGVMDEVDAQVQRLGQQCSDDLSSQGVVTSEQIRNARALLRYKATDTALMVDLATEDRMRKAFERDHHRQYGFIAPDKPIILDTLIVECRSHISRPPEPELRPTGGDAKPAAQTRFFAKGSWREAPIYELEKLGRGRQIEGPAIIVEPNGTIVIEPGWAGEIDASGNMILTTAGSRAPRVANHEQPDPVTLELFNNRYMSIAEQMGIILRNTSQSVNVKERLDFSCAIFDADGQLVANAPHVPVHLGSMDATVQTILSCGQEINPSDAFVQNNPHNGGSHLPDITVVTPVFDETDSTVLFFVASRAHHEDVGGVSPGSMSPFGKTIDDEGIVLDNLKLVEAGVFMTDAIERALGSGPYPARNIKQNVADLMAQVAANAAGASELRKLAAAHGLDTVHAYMKHIQDNAAASVRKVIATLDDGSAWIELDSGSQIAVEVRVDRVEERIVFDFTGTSPQQDNAFNAPPAVSRAAVLYVLRCLIADDIPLNAGCMRPVELVLPEGSMLRPLPPAAVVAGNVETSQAVTDALFMALGRLGTSQATMNNLTFGNSRYQYYETICSGAPAGPGFNGADAVHTHMTNTRMTDPEIFEQRFPVKLETFRIDRGSGGKGRWNAGDGITRRITFLEAMKCSILSDHRRTAPQGIDGGAPGRIGRNTIERCDGRVEDLGGCAQTEVEPGDTIIIETPTGGGYGSSELSSNEEES